MCTATTAAVSGPMLRRDVVEVERHRRGVAVDEPDTRAGVRGRGGGREERVRGDEHLAALDAERPQDDLERARARAHRDGVLRLVARRERRPRARARSRPA